MIHIEKIVAQKARERNISDAATAIVPFSLAVASIQGLSQCRGKLPDDALLAKFLDNSAAALFSLALIDLHPMIVLHPIEFFLPTGFATVSGPVKKCTANHSSLREGLYQTGIAGDFTLGRVDT